VWGYWILKYRFRVRLGGFATVRLKARKSNNIKVFIVFIQGHLLYFAFSHIDDIEFTGIKTGRILDFSPIKSVRRLRNGCQVFQQGEPSLQGIGQPFFPITWPRSGFDYHQKPIVGTANRPVITAKWKKSMHSQHRKKGKLERWIRQDLPDHLDSEQLEYRVTTTGGRCPSRGVASLQAT